MRARVVIAMACLTTPHVSAEAAVQVERDLAYGPNPLQKLDLYTPGGQDFVTVIFVHGGSLTSGDKSDHDYGDVGLALTSIGVACANINYRLGPESAWPSQPEDVAAAVTWVRDSIGSRGGDPEKLFLMGHSSGAMLVALIVADEHYLKARKVQTPDLRGVVAMGSIMFDAELEEAIRTHGRAAVEKSFEREPDLKMFKDLDAYLDQWPMKHVHAGMPPILFLIAASETKQPPVLRTDSTFVVQAKAFGNWADYKVLPGKTHYSSIRQLSHPGDQVLITIRDFVAQFTR